MNPRQWLSEGTNKHTQTVLRRAVENHPDNFELAHLWELCEVIAPLLNLYSKVLHRSHSFQALLQHQVKLLPLFFYNNNTNYIPALMLWLANLSYVKTAHPSLYQFLSSYPSLMNEEHGELANHLLLRQVHSNDRFKTNLNKLQNKYRTIHFVKEVEDTFFGCSQTSVKPLSSLVNEQSPLASSAETWLFKLVSTLELNAKVNTAATSTQPQTQQLPAQQEVELFEPESFLPTQLLNDLDVEQLVEQAVEKSKNRYFGNLHYRNIQHHFTTLFPNMPLDPLPQFPSFALTQRGVNELDSISEVDFAEDAPVTGSTTLTPESSSEDFDTTASEYYDEAPFDLPLLGAINHPYSLRQFVSNRTVEEMFGADFQDFQPSSPSTVSSSPSPSQNSSLGMPGDFT